MAEIIDFPKKTGSSRVEPAEGQVWVQTSSKKAFRILAVTAEAVTARPVTGGEACTCKRQVFERGCMPLDAFFAREKRIREGFRPEDYAAVPRAVLLETAQLLQLTGGDD